MFDDDGNPIDTGSSPSAEDRLMGLIGDNLEVSNAADTPAADDGQAQATPAKADDTATKADDQQPADEPRYKVKIQGEEKELPVSEIIKGYQLQSDYTKKTQQVAEERKAVETEREQLGRQREEFVQHAQTEMLMLQRQIEADQKVDWKALLEADPVGFLQQKEAAEARRNQYFQLRHQQEQVVNALQQEQQQRQAAYVNEQADVLRKELPDFFGDEAKSAETSKQLREFMSSNGFSEDEIAGVTHARDVKLLIKAMRYDQLEKAKVETQKKVQQPLPKVEAPRGQMDDSGSSLNKAAMDRLKRSGGRDSQSAIDAIASLI